MARRKQKTLTDEQFYTLVRQLLDDKVGGGAYSDDKTWVGDATNKGLSQWFGRDEFSPEGISDCDAANAMAEAFLNENVEPQHCEN